MWVCNNLSFSQKSLVCPGNQELLIVEAERVTGVSLGAAITSWMLSAHGAGSRFLFTAEQSIPSSLPSYEVSPRALQGQGCSWGCCALTEELQRSGGAQLAQDTLWERFQAAAREPSPLPPCARRRARSAPGAGAAVHGPGRAARALGLGRGPGDTGDPSLPPSVPPSVPFSLCHAVSDTSAHQGLPACMGREHCPSRRY